MKFEIEMMSSEMVTPCTPTPSHLKTHKLSFLDQIMPHLLTPAYFFYPPSPPPTNDDGDNLINNVEKRSHHLKKSLSQALTLFYPLAGRLVLDVGENGHVNCNDEGVAYVEARTDCMLHDVINNPNILAEEEDLILNKLLPYYDARDVVMVIQVTLFRCAGLALGLGFSHRVVDGFSVVMFLKSWATFSRGGGGSAVIASPKFECAALFPPEDDLVIPISRVEKKENIVTKKFMFSSQKINHLKETYGSGRSTRIETLSAFIGNRFMIATTSNTPATTSKVLRTLRIFVDVRRRVVPPLSEHHFGNIVIPAIIQYDSSKKEDKDGDNIGILIKKMKDAIRNVNGDSIAKLREQQQQQQQQQQHKNDNYNEEEAVMLGFTNFCNFPVQEIDFGWGVPMFVAGPNIAVNNMVFYCNSLCGGGNIDAWVNLKEEDMNKFQADSELLQHTCFLCP